MAPEADTCAQGGSAGAGSGGVACGRGGDASAPECSGTKPSSDSD